MVLLKGLKAEVSQIREAVQMSAATAQPICEKPRTTTQRRPSRPTHCTSWIHLLRNTALSNAPKQLFKCTNQHLTWPRREALSSSSSGLHLSGPCYRMPHPKPRCYSWIQTGEEFCQPCFRCGSSEHFRSGCRAQRPVKPVRGNPLNWKGSLHRTWCDQRHRKVPVLLQLCYTK